MKRLRFEDTKIEGRKPIYKILNKEDDIVGFVEYSYKWKNWVFITSDDFIFSYGCMQEIVDFMKDLGGRK